VADEEEEEEMEAKLLSHGDSMLCHCMASASEGAGCILGIKTLQKREVASRVDDRTAESKLVKRKGKRETLLILAFGTCALQESILACICPIPSTLLYLWEHFVLDIYCWNIEISSNRRTYPKRS
jgi:hypothetical protein